MVMQACRLRAAGRQRVAASLVRPIRPRAKSLAGGANALGSFALHCSMLAAKQRAELLSIVSMRNGKPTGRVDVADVTAGGKPCQGSASTEPCEIQLMPAVSRSRPLR